MDKPNLRSAQRAMKHGLFYGFDPYNANVTFALMFAQPLLAANLKRRVEYNDKRRKPVEM